MRRERVLVVDDNPQIQRLLRSHLLARDFDVQVTDRGRDALTTAADFDPTMILLTMGLPDINGVETCRRLREWTKAPIIVLSATNREMHDLTVAALDTGADDCVSKPLNIPELLARMRAVMRRAGEWSVPPPIGRLVFGNLVLDSINRRVTLSDQTLHLTPTEYNLLRVLAGYPGRVLTHRELLTAVWGAESAGDTQYLHVFVGQLRRKLEPRPDSSRHIFTEPGVGYRFSSNA